MNNSPPTSAAWVTRAGIACTRSACPLHPRIAVEVVALPKLSRRCREQTFECCNQVQALLATTKMLPASAQSSCFSILGIEVRLGSQ